MVKLQDMDQSQFYVYIYLDPRKPRRYQCSQMSLLYEPFYVGKGRGARMVKGLHRYRPSPKTSKIKAIKSSGLEPIPLLYRYTDTEELAFELERTLIAEIGRKDLETGPLVNLTAGGDGTAGIIRSAAYRAAVSKSLTGIKQSAETKAKRAAKLKGHVVSDLARQKISVANTGRIREKGWRHSEEARAKMRKPKSPQAIANMKLAWPSRPPISVETRAKISRTLTGRVQPEHVRAKKRGRVPWNKGLRVQV